MTPHSTDNTLTSGFVSFLLGLCPFPLFQILSTSLGSFNPVLGSFPFFWVFFLCLGFFPQF